MTIINFVKDFVNVLSGSSISFLLLSSTFVLILYYNLSGGTLKSKAGGVFIGSRQSSFHSRSCSGFAFSFTLPSTTSTRKATAST